MVKITARPREMKCADGHHGIILKHGDEPVRAEMALRQSTAHPARVRCQIIAPIGVCYGATDHDPHPVYAEAASFRLEMN